MCHNIKIWGSITLLLLPKCFHHSSIKRKYIKKYAVNNSIDIAIESTKDAKEYNNSHSDVAILAKGATKDID